MTTLDLYISLANIENMRSRFVAVDLPGLCERLHWALEAGDITPNALSELIGAARGTVGFVLTGRVKDPGINLLTAIGETLGVSLDWLVHGTEPAPEAITIQAAVARARERGQGATKPTHPEAA